MYSWRAGNRGCCEWEIKIDSRARIKPKLLSLCLLLFFAFASCSALADPYGCAVHIAGGDKDFRKMSVNSAPEKSGDLNGSLKFIWILEKKI